MKMVLWWLCQQTWSGKGCGVDFDMINVESMSFGNEKQRLFSKLDRKTRLIKNGIRLDNRAVPFFINRVSRSSFEK